MRTLASSLALLAALALVACEGETPSTTDPGVAPQDEGTPPRSGPAMPPEPAPAPSPQAEVGSDWRVVVSAADASNLGRLDQAWRLARAEAEDRGFAAEVEALGPLVDPNAGLAARLQPAPGNWRCRTVKLGARGQDGLAFVDYPPFRCTVELTSGGDLILTKTTGSQRVRGLLYPDTDRRLVFVGAQAWGSDERGYPAYGQMPERDQVGVFERIGPDRYRLVIPWPRVESKLEILELSR
jgi:hypothetical protein